MLNMIQKVLYGKTNNLTASAVDIKFNEKLVLGFLVVLILAFGIFPKPMLELTESTVNSIISKMITKHPKL
jgi:NADH-quinone oxidoreductase subunit M